MSFEKFLEVRFDPGPLVAKNYLLQEEIVQLNRLVTM